MTEVNKSVVVNRIRHTMNKIKELETTMAILKRNRSEIKTPYTIQRRINELNNVYQHGFNYKNNSRVLKSLYNEKLLLEDNPELYLDKLNKFTFQIKIAETQINKKIDELQSLYDLYMTFNSSKFSKLSSRN